MMNILCSGYDLKIIVVYVYEYFWKFYWRKKNGGFFNGNNNFIIERKFEYRIILIF